MFSNIINTTYTQGQRDFAWNKQVTFNGGSPKIRGSDNLIRFPGPTTKGSNVNVYGYSQAYGQADHAVTVEIIKKQLPQFYNIHVLKDIKTYFNTDINRLMEIPFILFNASLVKYA